MDVLLEFLGEVGNSDALRVLHGIVHGLHEVVLKIGGDMMPAVGG